MKFLQAICCAALTAASVGGVAAAAGPRGTISLGVTSEQDSASTASVASVIGEGNARRGRGASTVTGSVSARAVVVDTAATPSVPSYPTLKSKDPLLQNAAPFGPGSFWYGGAGNIACIYQAGSSPFCYTITGSAAGATSPAVNPPGIAAAVVERMQLAPGDLHASPAARGVTGSDSWFWLDPAPRERVLTTTLGGETVTVTATPTVRWEFGDGIEITGGAGVPYQPGTPPSDAIVHVFQTRCLPGDQGRNPYVLSSCGDGGYVLRALVVWQIGYSASGPVAASGALPARTTETSSAYPVSEVRAFLAGSAAP